MFPTAPLPSISGPAPRCCVRSPSGWLSWTWNGCSPSPTVPIVGETTPRRRGCRRSSSKPRTEPQLSRTKARYELTMQATRDPATGRDSAASHRRVHQAAPGNPRPTHAARRRIGVGRGRGSEQRHADVHQRSAATRSPMATGSSTVPNNSTRSCRLSPPASSRARTRGGSPMRNERAPTRHGLSGGFRGVGACQSIHYMVLYENRVSRRSRPSPSPCQPSPCTFQSNHLSGVYKLPEPDPVLTHLPSQDLCRRSHQPEFAALGGIS